MSPPPGGLSRSRRIGDGLGYGRRQFDAALCLVIGDPQVERRLTGLDLVLDGQVVECWPLMRSPRILETSLPGVFAAGDVRHGSISRVASAVGDGSVVISQIHEAADALAARR